jgi:hypothetical protein
MNKLNEAIRESEKIGNQSARIQAMIELGEVYLAHGDRRTARDTWSRALHLAGGLRMEREVAKLASKLEAVRPPSGLRPLSRWIGSFSRWKP